MEVDGTRDGQGIQPEEKRFEFVQNLGEGAYGTVWKCFDKENNIYCAIKRFKDAHRDEEVMRLALREIRLIKACAHPNVVHLHEAFRSKSGRVYMVMEHVDHTLTEELRRHPSGFSPASVKVITWQLLVATAFLHSNKVIHRDLKPANILISTEGTVKLCDFGFARNVTQDNTDYTQYVVTRWYRPPELLVGGCYGTPVDVWAIGCLFSEMATGRPLFPGRDTVDQMYLTLRTVGELPEWQMEMLRGDEKLAMVDVPPASELRSLVQRFPDFTREMMDVLRACLDPEPLKRLSAKELLSLPYFDDVFDLIDGTPLQQAYDDAHAAALEAAEALADQVEDVSQWSTPGLQAGAGGEETIRASAAALYDSTSEYLRQRSLARKQRAAAALNATEAKGVSSMTVNAQFTTRKARLSEGQVVIPAEKKQGHGATNGSAANGKKDDGSSSSAGLPKVHLPGPRTSSDHPLQGKSEPLGKTSVGSLPSIQGRRSTTGG